MTTVTADLVELLDDTGAAIGTAPRLSVHGPDTPLHRAFSVHLFDDRGQVLFTRRALTKATWPGVWTNSCCGHPRPGEDDRTAIVRRVREELGAEVDPDSLRLALPDFRYRATDASGVVENEICPVWTGRLAEPELMPDPDEVVEYAWLTPERALALAETPELISPWAVRQLPQLTRAYAVAASPTTAAPSDAATTLAAVDTLLRAELVELAEEWRLSAPERTVDVLGEDLPGWLTALVDDGGKRIRPTMVHWGHRAAGGGSTGPGHEAMIRAAGALEVLHVFALIHDDVMDRSDTRRGRPTAHIRAAAAHREADGSGSAEDFGTNIAILLGDLAHHQADRLAAELPASMRQEWWRLGTELIAGQRADLTGAAARRRDLAHAERVSRIKSGAYTITRPLRLGALAAGADDQVLAALADYGRHLGIAFALRDDLLGIWGDPRVTGKPAGDDLRAGKATIILTLAEGALADGLLSADAERVLRRVGSPDLTDTEVELLREALAEAGVGGWVEELIADEVRLAEGALSCPALTADGVAGLTAMARRIGWRAR
ncbi:isopentenyl-diphosphate delta-isomerase [Enemella evansiae]|nr:isopentenyl-diphosphate delta-isomerase [Enemella evansiae]